MNNLLLHICLNLFFAVKKSKHENINSVVSVISEAMFLCSKSASASVKTGRYFRTLTEWYIYIITAVVVICFPGGCRVYKYHTLRSRSMTSTDLFSNYTSRSSTSCSRRNLALIFYFKVYIQKKLNKLNCPSRQKNDYIQFFKFTWNYIVEFQLTDVRLERFYVQICCVIYIM